MKTETIFSEYRMKPSKAYGKRYDADDSKYYTDGTIILLRSAVKRPYKRMLERIPATRNVTENGADRVFSLADNRSAEALAVGSVVFSDPLSRYNMINLHTEGNMSCVTLDADRVKLILAKVENPTFWYTGKKNSVIIRSNGDPVGLIMPICDTRPH